MTLTVQFSQARDALLARQYESAYHQLMAIVKQEPGYHAAYFLLSRIASDFNNVNNEIAMLEKAVAIDTDNPDYWSHLARALAIKGDIPRALTALTRAKQLPHQTALSLDTIGATCNRLNDYATAAEFFEKAVERAPTHAGMWFNLASTRKFCGQFAEARAAYENAIALAPHYVKAHAALTTLGGITRDNNHIDRLTALYSTVTSGDDRLHIAHALSKEYEAIGDYEQSWIYLNDAKQKKVAEWPYCFSDDSDLFSALQAWTHSCPLPASILPTEARTPIFVVGMPRSGTTLVERLLSNHPQVATAGELPNFGLIVKSALGVTSPQLIDRTMVARSHELPFADIGQHYLSSTAHHYGDKSCLVDKLPLNALYVGHILRALPHAKIIVLDRDVRDTAMSNYRQLFSFSEKTYGYSLRVEDCFRFTHQLKALCDTWQAQAPNAVYTVNYEDLVNNPDAEVERLFAFCGLVFDSRHLAIERNGNPVATASAVQVRKPISTSSVGQWRHYRAAVDAAEAALACDLSD
jgi:tetratricopeptide (TPR) repeat protein